MGLIRTANLTLSQSRIEVAKIQRNKDVGKRCVTALSVCLSASVRLRLTVRYTLAFRVLSGGRRPAGAVSSSLLLLRSVLEAYSRVLEGRATLIAHRVQARLNPPTVAMRAHELLRRLAALY